GEVDRAAARDDGVGVALGPRPVGGLEDAMRHVVSLSRKRWSLPVSVLGSAATNSTCRGYLYGAMVAFTKSWICWASALDGSWLGLSTTKAFTACPRSSSGRPTTAHSATLSCCSTAAST